MTEPSQMLARPLEEVASACDVGAASSSGFAGTITDDTPSSRVPVRVDVPQSVESSGVEPLALFDLPRGAYQEPEAA